jgi:hypothetical protein
MVFAGDLDGMDAQHISHGDTQPSVPPVDKICHAINAATDGSFIGAPGTFVTVLPECATKSRRARNTPECQQDQSKSIAALPKDQKQQKIDDLCAGGATSLVGDTAVYCALRSVNANGQAKQYCDAYDSSKRASGGLFKMLAIDGTAAGVCWAEYMTLLATMTANNAASISAKADRAGPCSMASIGAGLAEIMNIVLANTGKNRHPTGQYAIDSDGNPTDKNREDASVTKVVDIVMSSGLSLAVIRNGICQQVRGAHSGVLPDNELVQKVCNSLAWKPKKEQANAQNALARRDAVTPEPVTSLIAASDYNKARLQSRIDVAHSSAMMLSALAAIRGTSLGVAKHTQKQAKTILQSIFTSQSGGGTPLGGTAISYVPTGIFQTSGSSAFTPTNQTPAVQAATAENTSPEKFLVPPGSALANTVQPVAANLSPEALEGAASGGASGIGGLIASTADAMGAKDTGPIRSALSSIFANLPKDDGAGYTGGGSAKSLAKGGGGGGDLNLKSLFGGGDKEGGTAAAAPALAFRGLASDDIWHSKNPKGNNLFQIISERYDTAQRTRDLNP